MKWTPAQSVTITLKHSLILYWRTASFIPATWLAWEGFSWHLAVTIATVVAMMEEVLVSFAPFFFLFLRALLSERLFDSNDSRLTVFYSVIMEIWGCCKWFWWNKLYHQNHLFSLYISQGSSFRYSIHAYTLLSVWPRSGWVMHK